MVVALLIAGCQDGGQPSATTAPSDPPPASKPVSNPPETKPSDKPVEAPVDKPAEKPAADTPPPAATEGPPFALPPGYDEAEAGLQQNDKDLLAQAMAVLPPTNYDAQAIRLIVAAALADATAIKKETSSLAAQETPFSPYSVALSDLARSLAAPKQDWNHLDSIANGMNARKGCVLVYDALALFAKKAGDKDRESRFKKMAAAHAGQDG